MYKKSINKFKDIAKKRYQNNVVFYNYINNNYIIKKLISICTKKGLKSKIENTFLSTFIWIKYITKKDIYLIIEKAFALLNTLLGNTLEYFGTRKIIKGILLNNYQQGLQSAHQFVKHMKTIKHKSLAIKVQKALLELYIEKGYLLLEKRKKYVSILKANQ